MDPSCVVCGVNVGSTFMRNEWKESVCIAHSGLPGCLWCGSHRGIKENNGIFACVDCQNSEVTSTSEITDCIDEILQWFTAIVGPHQLDDVPVTYGGLAIPPPGGGTLGWTNGQWSGSKGWAEILTVPHVPITALHQILTHEFTHAVLMFDPHSFRPHQTLIDNDVENEGMCELFSHKYLLQRGDQRSSRLAERIERNPHPVYGSGFRQCKSEFRHIGDLAEMVARKTQWVRRAPTNLAPKVSHSTSGVAASQPSVHRAPVSISAPENRQVKQHRPMIDMKKQVASKPSPQEKSSRPIIEMNKHD